MPGGRQGTAAEEARWDSRVAAAGRRPPPRPPGTGACLASSLRERLFPLPGGASAVRAPTTPGGRVMKVRWGTCPLFSVWRFFHVTVLGEPNVQQKVTADFPAGPEAAQSRPASAVPRGP